MSIQIIKLNICPNGEPEPVVQCSQGDAGREFKIDLYDGEITYTPPSGATYTILGRKANKKIFQYNTTSVVKHTIGDPVYRITVILKEEMTNVGGPAECELLIKSGSIVLGTANFILLCEGGILASAEDGDYNFMLFSGSPYSARFTTDDVEKLTSFSAPASIPDGHISFTQLITNINVGELRSKVQYTTSLQYLFYQCKGLQHIVGLANWDVSNITTTRYLFYGCTALQDLDLDFWDTSSCSDMSYMFSQCTNLRKIWVRNTFVATAVTNDTYKPFYGSTFRTGKTHVYTDATSAAAQGWGTINSNFEMHYNATYSDYVNA